MLATKTRQSSRLVLAAWRTQRPTAASALYRFRSMSSVVEGSLAFAPSPAPSAVTSDSPARAQRQDRQPRAQAQQQQASSLDGREVLGRAVAATAPRHDWTREEISAVYETPLMELVHQSVRVAVPAAAREHRADMLQGILHRRFHSPGAIQMCTLMNIKTGGCSEDCSYCAQ